MEAKFKVGELVKLTTKNFFSSFVADVLEMEGRRGVVTSIIVVDDTFQYKVDFGHTRGSAVFDEKELEKG